MKTMIVVCAVCALLAGCDYSVPLVESPKLGIDSAVVGLWQRSNEDQKVERLLVLPMSEQEYLVVFPAGSKDEMFARACLWRNEGVTLVQLNWFGNGQGETPEDKRTFQYVSYTVEPEKLRLRLLNADVVKNIASSEALAKAIADNKDKPNLFREEMVFQRLKNGTLVSR